ncbi:putative ankyrin repeat protein [Parachaetomium inaequale]|uniref:Ankyrin repeat protein n=1 Tax=Parachaetomium inaequale TaxID=2588326 RepID=A0AAN6SKT6_9PEZI|nr:putative ankyrin repeat protein [Parachaetomium inaequale]
MIDKDDVSNYNPDNVLPEHPAVVEQIRKWLQPTAYLHKGGEYRRHLASHAEGTGHWLTATETYRKWHDGSDHGLLWIRGIPGSGKSVFAAKLADQLAREGGGSYPVLFFFFRQIIDANHKPVNMLRDWLDQVLEHSPPLQRDLKVYVDKGHRKLNRKLESIGTDQLWEHLKTALAHLPRVYLVADALDEMDRGNDECLKTLGRLGLWRPGQVKVLITSRPVGTVEEPLREFPALRIRLEERLVDTDIATYVQHSMASAAISPGDRALIEAAVPGRANGLFLYAKLAMDAFLEPDAQVYEVLAKLPADLNAMYFNLLAEHARISGVPADTQRLLLCWVTYATRPLRLLEMAEMLRVVSPGALGDSQDVKSARALVRGACGPLLEIHPDETVSVVHHSLTEFLLGSTQPAATGRTKQTGTSFTFPILMPGPTHKQLALSCIRYLQSSGCLDPSEASQVSRTDQDLLRTSCSAEERQKMALRLEFPFAEYACENWATHAARSFHAGPASAALISALDGFLSPGSRLEAWLRMSWRRRETADVTASHIAARYGLTPYLQHLLDLGRDGTTATLGCMTSGLETPLSLAAEAGHADTAKLLIAAGADLNAEDAGGYHPIHRAAENNHAGVVAALLGAGVDPLTEMTHKERGSSRGGGGKVWKSTPLLIACRAGHVAVVEALLPWLQDMGAVQQALAWAARAGQGKLVKRLLQHPGIEINAMVGEDTALFNACRRADVESIEALVSAGADATILCLGTEEMFGYDCRRQNCHDGPISPLEVFCSSWENNDDGPVLGGGGLERALELLLRAGADLHRRDAAHKTPLHYAAGRDGGTLLHMRHDHGDAGWELIKLLVEEGKADINKRRRSDGKTPVMAMDWKGPLGTCLRFIKAYSPDCTIADDAGDTPLHMAAGLTYKREQDEAIDAILAAGARVDQRNRKGETALHVASESAVERLVRQGGADLEARDYDGATPLMRSVYVPLEDRRGLMDRLLGVGARLDATDFAGRTIVHEMAGCLSRRESGYNYGLEDLEHLLSLGADVSRVDHGGNTVLHELSLKRDHPGYAVDNRVAAFECLIRRGVDANAVNHDGQTVLHRFGGHSRDLNPLLVGAAIAACHKKTIDLPDHKGWRPIHFAAAASKHTVARLMSAGADISAPTYDGRTPLHLAASAGKSNILGMLITEITKAARYRDAAAAIIDGEDKEGHTPLYHACRSGHPESVAVLLNAGAEVKRWSGRLLMACSEFEQADRLRTQAAKGSGDEYEPVVEAQTFHQIGGTEHMPHFHTRLDEILALLADHGLDHSATTDAQGRTHLQAAFDVVSDSDLDHTVRCLSRLGLEAKREAVDDTFTIRWAEIRREAAARAFNEAGAVSLATEHRKRQKSLLVQLLGMREFDLVEAAVKTRGWSPCVPSQDGLTLLHALVALGHASLLARVATPDLVRRIDDAAWRQEQGDLIEWWQAYQGLPYLLSRQPDLERRDRKGMTPLQKTLASRWRAVGLFQKHAVKVLAAAGADVNAVTADGKSCLCLAASSGDAGLVELLIALGTRVTVAAVLAAVESAQSGYITNPHAAVGVLEALLSAPETPGQANNPASQPRGQLPGCLQQHHGTVVLHRAATLVPDWLTEEAGREPRKACAEMVSLLLARGADPFGTLAASELSDKMRVAAAASNPETAANYYPLTVLHDVLLSNGTIEPFLQLPTLNLEHRNKTGHTLLLAACAHPGTFRRTITCPGSPPQPLITHLIHLGADPSATEIHGRNALHSALSTTPPPGYGPPDQDPTTFTSLIRSLLSTTATTTTPNQTRFMLNTPDETGATPRTVARDRLVGAALLGRFAGLLGPGSMDVRNGAGETVVFGLVKTGGFGQRVWAADGFDEEGEGVWRALRAQGVDFGVRDGEGRGLLHVAAERGEWAGVFERLVRGGAGLDVMAVDGKGRTGLDVAAASGNQRVFGMFAREEGGTQ